MKAPLQILFFFCLLVPGLATLSAQMIGVEPIHSFELETSFPSDVHGEKAGTVYVLDALNNRVVKLKLNGEVQFIEPQRENIYKAVGITIADGDIWIADTPRNRLLRLAENGRVKSIITLGHGIEPVDLAAVNDVLVVTDRYNHAVSVVEKGGDEKYFWGERGNGLSQFINPGFIAVGPEDRLIIGDILNRRIMSYTQSGRFPQIVAQPGINSGEVFRPKGIALDSRQRIWVADGYTGSLQAFAMGGSYLGNADIQLQTPMGIFIDDEDRIWVVESMANRVTVLQIKN